MALISRLRPHWDPYSRRGRGPNDIGPVHELAPRLHDPNASLDDLIDELSDRWARGETPRAEEYVARLVGGRPDDAATLAYHEFQLAESAGLHPDPDALLDRFPDHRARLQHLLRLHEALDPFLPRLLIASSEAVSWADPSAPPTGPELPMAGDDIGHYRLVRELGRGAFARVFLAEQADLEDRYVVLKVSTRISPEPRLLARARHAQIVEVIERTEAHDEGGTLHLLCMPFLGGATLADVLNERRRWGGPPRQGVELLTDLDHVAAPEYPQAGRAGAAREILAALSYPRAVAWIVARLVEALDHAATRDVTHGDLKPSNILLAADGRPLLFDFNLAVDWRRFEGDDLPPAELGGTLAYMAPERLRALADPDNAPAPGPADRHRADIYALGLILIEALSGHPPSVPGAGWQGPRATAAALADARSEPGRALRDFEGSIPPALRPILSRCLAPDPADRYARSAELAEDLDRYRADLPPRHAGPIARRHRLTRWARRHRLPVAGGVLLLAGALPALGLSEVRSQAEVALAVLTTRHIDARARLDELWGGATPGVYRFRRNGQRIPTAEVDTARSALDALSRYGLTEPGPWRDRPDVAPLPETDRLDLDAWLMEQAWRYADAIAARPGPEWTSDLERALAILQRVGGPAPPTPLLSQADRLRDLLGQPRAPARPASLAAPPWLEQYLQGVADEDAHPADAVVHYRDSLRARPESYWSHYRLAAAACHPDVRDYALAERQIRRCQALRPGNPLLHLFRAGLLFHLDQPGAAYDESRRALDLDPQLIEAYRTRFWARLKVNQDEAITAVRKPTDPDPVAADYRRLEILIDKQEPSRSWQILRDARAAFGRDEALPDGDARERLEAAAFSDPDARRWLAQQLYRDGRAMAAVSEYDRLFNKGQESIDSRFDRAVILSRFDPGGDRTIQELETLAKDPGFQDFARRFPKAIRTHHMLVRGYIHRGEIDQALHAGRRGLVLADRLDTHLGESLYALARALAHAASTHPELLPEVVERLKDAERLYPAGAIRKLVEVDMVFHATRSAILDSIGDPRNARSKTP